MKKTFLILILFMFLSAAACGAADLSGMWWDVNKPGTGVYIDYKDGAGVCGSWYLYDERGNPLWLTFVGRAENNIFNGDLYEFTGPPMGQTWDNSSIRSEPVGSIRLDLTNPDQLSMKYEIGRETGSLNLTRFSSESCRGSLWWDINKQGQGLAHFHFAGSSGEDLTGIVWYVYDTSGNPTWYTAIGNPDASRFDALQFTGPALGDPWDSTLVKSTKAGTITAKFDEEALQKSYMPKINMGFNIGGITGTLNLVPFVCPVAVPHR